MAKQATINPSYADKADRSIERCKRLKESIAKNKDRGNTDKCESLQSELARRMDELNQLKSKLAELDG